MTLQCPSLRSGRRAHCAMRRAACGGGTWPWRRRPRAGACRTRACVHAVTDWRVTPRGTALIDDPALRRGRPGSGAGGRAVSALIGGWARYGPPSTRSCGRGGFGGSCGGAARPRPSPCSGVLVSWMALATAASSWTLAVRLCIGPPRPCAVRRHRALTALAPLAPLPGEQRGVAVATVPGLFLPAGALPLNQEGGSG